jgi:hypothetical protein
MPMRAQKAITRSPSEKLIRAYVYEATPLRDLAASVTTARLKTRLLEEAANQARLAEEAKRGIFQPHSRPVGDPFEPVWLLGHPNFLYFR